MSDGLRRNTAGCHSTNSALKLETIKVFARSAEETRRNAARAAVLRERENAENIEDN